MIFISKKRILGSFVILFIAFFAFAAGITRDNVIETSGDLRTYKIIVDAGHGLPDGGAVSESGIEEANLNLEIALKLEEELLNNGYDVVMTRKSEKSIADSDKQSSIRQIKSSDLANRVNIANESGADFMISIHMNKYTDSKYWGWQTFYSKNSENREKTCKLNTKFNFK